MATPSFSNSLLYVTIYNGLFFLWVYNYAVWKKCNTVSNVLSVTPVYDMTIERSNCFVVLICK